MATLPNLAGTAPSGGSGAMFDRIARRYDLLNRILSLGLDRRWRQRLVDALQVTGPAQILDVATGTADQALAIARALPRATIVGADPSPEMLAVGQRKITAAGLAHRITLIAGEATALPFADHTFAATCISFGIRNVPDRLAGLAELARVTRPGGRVLLLELGEPRRGPWAPLARWHVRHLVPRLGAWLSGDAEYRYLQSSIAAFPAPAEFVALMQRVGLEGAHVVPLSFDAAHLYIGEVAGSGAHAHIGPTDNGRPMTVP